MSEVELTADGFEVPNTVPLFKHALGWRGWNLTASGHLMSRGIGTWIWDPEENHAECALGESHRAPDNEHTCGLYAMHTPVHDPFMGIVRARGKLCVHEQGFRAEYAEVVCFVTTLSLESHIKQVVDRYQAPLFRLKGEAMRYAKDFGEFIPKELRTFKREDYADHVTKTLAADATSQVVGKLPTGKYTMTKEEIMGLPDIEQSLSWKLKLFSMLCGASVTIGLAIGINGGIH